MQQSRGAPSIWVVGNRTCHLDMPPEHTTVDIREEEAPEIQAVPPDTVPVAVDCTVVDVPDEHLVIEIPPELEASPDPPSRWLRSL